MSASLASEPAEPPRVVIVGGGIAGLAAAWELEPQSRAGTLGVDLFEASSRLGGSIASERTGGQVLEGGPDCFLTTKPAALELCEELGLSESVIGVRPSARRAYIYRGGRLHRIPALLGPGRWASARSVIASDLISRGARLRMLLGGAIVRLRPIRADERSALGPQLRSRFGKEAVDWLLEPLVAGVHPAPLDVLSASVVANVLPSRWIRGSRPSTRPSRVPALPPGEAPRRHAPSGVFASLREGMDQLPRALAERLKGAKVHPGQRITELRRADGRSVVVLADGQAITADGLILAIPPPAAAQLLAGAFPTAAARLAEVKMESLVVVAAVFDRTAVPMALDGSGVLVPRRSGLPVSALTWLSAKWERTAPSSEEVALRVFLRSEPGGPDLPSSEEALAVARQGLREVMGITAAPRYATVFPHRAALAWYEVGHADRIRGVRRILGDGSGVELAGSSYDGMGIPDAIRSGRNAARRVRSYAGLSHAVAVPDEASRATPSSSVTEGSFPRTVGSPG